MGVDMKSYFWVIFWNIRLAWNTDLHLLPMELTTILLEMGSYPYVFLLGLCGLNYECIQLKAMKKHCICKQPFKLCKLKKHCICKLYYFIGFNYSFLLCLSDYQVSMYLTYSKKDPHKRLQAHSVARGNRIFPLLHQVQPHGYNLSQIHN